MICEDCGSEMKKEQFYKWKNGKCEQWYYCDQHKFRKWQVEYGNQNTLQTKLF